MIRINLAKIMAEQEPTPLKIAELSQATGISRTTLTNLYYRRSLGVNFETIDKLCEYFNCGIEEIISYVPVDLPTDPPVARLPPACRQTGTGRDGQDRQTKNFNLERGIKMPKHYLEVRHSEDEEVFVRLHTKALEVPVNHDLEEFSDEVKLLNYLQYDLCIDDETILFNIAFNADTNVWHKTA